MVSLSAAPARMRQRNKGFTADLSQIPKSTQILPPFNTASLFHSESLAFSILVHLSDNHSVELFAQRYLEENCGVDTPTKFHVARLNRLLQQ